MADGRHELGELTYSELSEASGGVVAIETSIREEPCNIPTPSGPIPMPYPLQSSGDLLR